jgi:hypothetical protein
MVCNACSVRPGGSRRPLTKPRRGSPRRRLISTDGKPRDNGRSRRPAAEAHRLYLSVIAQIALRTLREVFAATPEDMVSTVVFNGLVDTIDPRTGIAIKPHFITLRATRDQFAPLVLDQPKFSPVQCVQKYFFGKHSRPLVCLSFG